MSDGGKKEEEGRRTGWMDGGEDMPLGVQISFFFLWGGFAFVIEIYR